MRSSKFVIPGDPTALARARYGNGKVYDCQKEIKGRYSIILDGQHDEAPFFAGPLHLVIAFYFAMPKKSSIKHLEKLQHTPRSCKPDLSNLVKLVEDVANTIIYKDDALIAITYSFKLYDYPEYARTEFTLKEINYEEKFYPFSQKTYCQEPCCQKSIKG